MYLGEAMTNQDSLTEFMNTAKDLEVKDLIIDAISEDAMDKIEEKLFLQMKSNRQQLFQVLLKSLKVLEAWKILP